MPETDTKIAYTAQTGIDWTTADGEARRVEAGDVADDFNADDIEWLVAQGHIAVYVAPEQVVEPEPEPAPKVVTPVPVVDPPPFAPLAPEVKKV